MKKIFKSFFDTIYSKYHNQEVEVIRECTSDEVDFECGPMFLVKFPDNKVSHAFEDELFDSIESKSFCPTIKEELSNV